MPALYLLPYAHSASASQPAADHSLLPCGAYRPGTNVNAAGGPGGTCHTAFCLPPPVPGSHSPPPAIVLPSTCTHLPPTPPQFFPLFFYHSCACTHYLTTCRGRLPAALVIYRRRKASYLLPIMTFLVSASLSVQLASPSPQNCLLPPGGRTLAIPLHSILEWFFIMPYYSQPLLQYYI